nr:integrase, catalytic region, zinc finger, CCHC-type, peptidase aspartic, catalytic [Tanacetum cinerariifolium]
MSDSDESGVTYTDISSPFEELSDIGSPRADDHKHLELPEMLEDPYIEPPEYVPRFDLEAHPEDDDDEDPKEDHVDYPTDGGDDGDDEEGAPIKDHVNDVKFGCLCDVCGKCMIAETHHACAQLVVTKINESQKSKSVKKHKNKNVWKPTGNVFTDVGYKWKPTGQTFTIVGNSCPLTRFTSTNVVPPKQTPSHSVEIQKPEIKVYSKKPKIVNNASSSKMAKIVESKNANHSEPNHTWGSIATYIPSSSSLVMIGYPDCTLGMVTIDWETLLSQGEKQKKSSHQPKAEDTNQEKLYLLHMDLCGPMRVASINEKRYILVIIDDYSPGWTKDHPIANVIGDPSYSVSTRKQLETNSMWCYFDAFLTSVEPKNFKPVMNEPSWIDAMQEEIHEFERLKVWELVPCPDNMFLIKLK